MASIMAIIKAGLVPVLVEPNIDTFNIDFNDMRAKMMPQVKAVMRSSYVWFFGGHPSFKVIL